ncbi:hypothetical protein AYI70_g6355 [Smittium culicis]|uniref:Uncharacterized protein n=1 Tax=Smittium culicis TaxID=133412 RepID=A0A1R1XQE9_9FUNG|nr:hypothetical protein AYI70_g6355 [Smittium culicis]
MSRIGSSRLQDNSKIVKRLVLSRYSSNISNQRFHSVFKSKELYSDGSFDFSDIQKREKYFSDLQHFKIRSNTTKYSLEEYSNISSYLGFSKFDFSTIISEERNIPKLVDKYIEGIYKRVSHENTNFIGYNLENTIESIIKLDSIKSKIDKSSTRYIIARKSIENIIEVCSGSSEITEAEFLKILGEFQSSNVLEIIEDRFISRFLKRIVFFLLQKKENNSSPISFYVANYITILILKSKYYFKSVIGFNQLIKLLVCFGNIDQAVQIKDALRFGNFGKKLNPDTKTYESLLVYTKFNKEGELKHHPFSKENIDAIKMGWKRDSNPFDDFFEKPDLQKFFEKNKVKWSFLVFLELVQRRIQWTNRLEELLILSALDNHDYILLQFILQKNEDHRIKKMFNTISTAYVDNNNKIEISIRLSKLRAKIWYYFDKQSPAKREIAILEKIKAPPVPNISDFSDVIKDSFNFINNLKASIITKSMKTNLISTSKNPIDSSIYAITPFDTSNFISSNLNNSKPLDIFQPIYYNLAIKKLFQRYKYFDSIWISYEYYLRTLLKQYQWQKALLELSEMRLLPIDPPSPRLYQLFVSFLSSRKEALFLMDIYSMMKLDGIRVDSLMYEDLINGCMSGELNDSLAYAIDRLEKNKRNSITVTSKEYLNFGRINKFQFAKKIIHDIKRSFPISESVFGFNVKSAFGHIFSPIENYLFSKTKNNKTDFIEENPNLSSTSNKNISVNINKRSDEILYPNKTTSIGPSVIFEKQSIYYKKYPSSLHLNSLKSNSFESLKNEQDYYSDPINHELLFFNQALYFYNEYTSYIKEKTSNTSKIVPMQLNTALCILHSLVFVKEPILFPTNFFINKRFELDPNKLQELTKDKINTRAYSIAQFYYNIIDTDLQSSVITNNYKEFFSDKKYYMLLKIPYQYFYSLEMYNESNRILESALRYGISI